MIKKVLILSGMFLILTLSTQPIFAISSNTSGKALHSSEMENKFYAIIQYILNNRGRLELSQEQTRQVKKLASDVRKWLIQQDAKIKTLTVEIDTIMWEFPFDTESVNSFISEKYRFEAEKAKHIIKSYELLNVLLNEDQKEILKSVS
ncbi:MAG: hypothetical protein ABH869_04730 [Candidatus Omnitrophota bacterium]